jgi:hypothetical protein
MSLGISEPGAYSKGKLGNRRVRQRLALNTTPVYRAAGWPGFPDHPIPAQGDVVTTSLQADIHFIAKYPGIHANDALQAIFTRSGATKPSRSVTGRPFTGYNLRFCLRNTVFRSLKGRESRSQRQQGLLYPAARPALGSKILVFGFFLFFG